MPNWCYNTMSLTGSKKEIKKFIKDIRSDENGYDMNKLVPLDERASKTVEMGEAVISAFSTSADGFDGYGHAIDRWGSKWGACSIETDYPLANTVRYESAWSPCTQLIINISVQYPNVIFSVVSTEEADLFACYEVIHNGNIVERGEIDPQNYDPEMQKVHDKATHEGTEEAWEEYYDALSEWNEKILDRLDTACDDITKQYEKHLAKIKRQRREGRMPDEFIPE